MDNPSKIPTRNSMSFSNDGSVDERGHVIHGYNDGADGYIYHDEDEQYRSRDAQLSGDTDSPYSNAAISSGRAFSAASTLPSFGDGSSAASSAPATTRQGTGQSSAATPTTTYMIQHNQEMENLKKRFDESEWGSSPQHQQLRRHGDVHSMGGESTSLYSAYDAANDAISRMDVALEFEVPDRSQRGYAQKHSLSNAAKRNSSHMHQISEFSAAMRAHNLKKPVIPGTLQTFEVYGAMGVSGSSSHHGSLIQSGNESLRLSQSLVSSQESKQRTEASHTSILDSPKYIPILQSRLNPLISKQHSQSRQLKDLSSMFRQGWSLDKGYDRRPRLNKVDSDSIHRDIEEFAQRNLLYAGRGPQHKFGSTKRSEPRMWGHGIIVARNAINPTRKQDVMGADDDCVPGPKYDVESLSPGRARKTAPFSTAPRFGIDIPLASQGPEVRDGDRKAFSSIRSKGAVRIDSSGRMLYNSIFYEHFITPTKGLPIDTSKAISTLSKYTSFEGTKLPPKILENATGDSRNKLDPLKKLKAIRREIDEYQK